VIVLTIFTFAAPVSFLLLIHFITFLLRELTFNPHQPSKPFSMFGFIIIALLTIGSFGGLSYFAYDHARAVLHCGFLWCLDPSKFPQPEEVNMSKNSEGFKSTVSAPLIFISATLILTFLLILFREFYYRCIMTNKSAKSIQTGMSEPLLNDSPSGINSDESGATHSVSFRNSSTPISTYNYTPSNTYYQSSTPSNKQSKTVNTTRNYTIMLFFSLCLLVIIFLSMFFFTTSSQINSAHGFLVELPHLPLKK